MSSVARARERDTVHGQRRPISGSTTDRRRPPRPDDDPRVYEKRLLTRFAATRDPLALDELVERFMPLAQKLASRYRGGREPFDDLLQVANCGLVKAIQRFDPARTNSFSSFAAPTILGELRRHFRDRGWSVRVPRSLQEQSAHVERALAELPGRLGRSPSVAEVAARVGITTDEVLEATQASNARYAAPFDRTPANGEDRSLPFADRIGKEDSGYELVDYGAAIAPALAAFSARDRLVLHLRFVEDLTQTEIARRIGCSQMHVSRILRARVQQLRDEARSGG